jgi:hypothetical protein
MESMPDSVALTGDVRADGEGDAACPKRPPAMAEWLLRRLLPNREGEMIADDLREELAARGAAGESGIGVRC